jgi:hypothetical protein
VYQSCIVEFRLMKISWLSGAHMGTLGLNLS